MRTIETIATVNDDDTLTAQVPRTVERGRHRVVIVIDDTTLPAARGHHHPLSDMARFRASLGISTYPGNPGNTVVEMREEERF